MAEATELDVEEAAQIRTALKVPRGRYGADRASQLSGIPRSTLYWWARRPALEPDYVNAKPMLWSYRDLVFARLMGWLRVGGMPLDLAAERVAWLKERLRYLKDETIGVVRVGGRAMFLGPEDIDQMTGQALLDGISSFLPSFDLLEPLEEGFSKNHRYVVAAVLPPELDRGHYRGWAPNLVRPSPRTRISPWVQAGEPCVVNSRIPTGSIWALAEERNLTEDDINHLYPTLDKASILEALNLERRLRAA